MPKQSTLQTVSLVIIATLMVWWTVVIFGVMIMEAIA